MSSEESGSEDGEEINVVMELPWHSSLVDEFFQSLDSQLMSEKSAKAKILIYTQESLIWCHCYLKFNWIIIKFELSYWRYMTSQLHDTWHLSYDSCGQDISCFLQ